MRSHESLARSQEANAFAARSGTSATSDEFEPARVIVHRRAKHAELEPERTARLQDQRKRLGEPEAAPRGIRTRSDALSSPKWSSQHRMNSPRQNIWSSVRVTSSFHSRSRASNTARSRTTETFSDAVSAEGRAMTLRGCDAENARARAVRKGRFNHLCTWCEFAEDSDRLRTDNSAHRTRFVVQYARLSERNTGESAPTFSRSARAACSCRGRMQCASSLWRRKPSGSRRA